MAVSIAATKSGTHRSRASAGLSTAGAASIDVLSVYHGLGKSPDDVRATLRSVISAPSSPPQLAVASWNASVATIHLVSQYGAQEANVDVVCEITHSLVK